MFETTPTDVVVICVLTDSSHGKIIFLSFDELICEPHSVEGCAQATNSTANYIYIQYIYINKFLLV